MRIEAIIQQAVYDHKITEETKSDPSVAVQRFEQRKERIAAQLQRIQQNNKSGEAGQTKKENLQKQMNNINKQIQTLTQQKGISISGLVEETKPSTNPLDKYVKSEGRSAADSAGIYRLEKDKEGNLGIILEQPEEADVNAADNGTDEKQAGILEEEDKAAAVSDEEDNLDVHPEDQEDKDEKASGSSPTDEDSEIITTVNTDKVDAEIRKIQKEKQQIEQEIRQAAGDDTKSAKLEKRLKSIESELKVKDNDTYRMQQAEYTVSVKKND